MVGSPINKKFPEISGSWKVNGCGVKKDTNYEVTA